MTQLNLTTRKSIYYLSALLCLLPVFSAPLALLLGVLLAQLMEHPFPQLHHKATNWLLKFSVVGLGFGMNLSGATAAGKEGVLFTVVSIFGVLIVGFLLGKLFQTGRKTSFLISAGTAICGGSAIAALSPVMKAGDKEISVALGIVFMLNSAALVIFPAIGHALHLSQAQFGMWCAIAIHDTSSVVGAAGKYGQDALQIATTVKLARALWIVPVAFGTAFVFKTDRTKVKVPYFIGIFILAMLGNTYVAALHEFSPFLVAIAKKGLTLTLFLIGSGLSLNLVRSVGIKPFMQGLILWGAISVLSLWAIVLVVK